MRRARALLGLAFAILLGGQVLAAVGIGSGVLTLGASSGTVLVAALLLCVSLAALAGVARGPIRHRPDSWPSRALMVALPGGLAAGLCVGSVLGSDVPQVVAVSAGGPIVVVALAALASRAMRGLSAADACTLDTEFVTTLRRADREGWPRWSIPDEVAVNGTEIVVVVRSGRIGAAQFRIPLAEVTAAGVHAAPAERGPWLSLPNGTELLIPPGAVVVIRHGKDSRVLPVFDPAELVEAIETRRKHNYRNSDHSAD